MPDETITVIHRSCDYAGAIIDLLRENSLDPRGQIAALGGAMAKVFFEIEPLQRQAAFEKHLNAMTIAWPDLVPPRRPRRSTWARLLMLLGGSQ